MTFEGGRVRRGWRLTKIAWELMAGNRGCLALGVGGTTFAALAAWLILVVGGALRDPAESSVQLALVGALALYLSTLISAFFGAALSQIAAAALEGERMTTKVALRGALRRWDQLALWSLISATVGVILEQIANRIPFGGRVASWVVGAAWALATMFVVPILALEPSKGAISSIGTSSSVFRGRWGESITGQLTITAWMWVVAVPVFVLACLGAAAADGHPGLQLGVLGAVLIAFAFLGAVGFALRQVFAVALYRFAVAGSSGPFPPQVLERPFSARPKHSMLQWAYWSLGAVVAIVIVAMILAAIFGNRDGDGYVYSRDGYFQFTASSSVAAGIQDDDPVVSNGRRVGHVYDVQEEDNGDLFIIIKFRDDLPGLGWRSGGFRVAGPPGRRYVASQTSPWGADGRFRGSFGGMYAHDVDLGMPIRTRDGRQVGAVLDRWTRDRRVLFVYQLRRRFQRQHVIRLADRFGTPHLVYLSAR